MRPIKLLLSVVLIIIGLVLFLSGFYLWSYPPQSKKVRVNARIVGINGTPNGTCQDRSNHRAVCTLSVTFPLNNTVVNATYDYDGPHNYVSGDTISLYVNPDDITDIALAQPSVRTATIILLVFGLAVLLSAVIWSAI